MRTIHFPPRSVGTLGFPYTLRIIRVHDAEEGLTGWLTPKPGAKPYKFRNNAYPPECYPQIKQLQGLQIDNQGRVLILKFKNVVLINVYCPADSTGQHTAYRNQFFELLDFKVRALRTHNFEVIITGDFNVVYDPKDSENTLIEHEKFRTSEYTNDELIAWIEESNPRQIFRNWFSELKLTDCTRTFHPKRTKMYTAWDIRKNHRAINSGSRIDLVITSPGIKCTDSNILPDIDGSDHCPVYADILLDYESQTNHQLPLLCRVNSSVFDSNLQKYFLKSQK